MRRFSAFTRTVHQPQTVDKQERNKDATKQALKQNGIKTMGTVINTKNTATVFATKPEGRCKVGTSVSHLGQQSCSEQIELSADSDGIPWHVAMIHEKEKCVLMLEEKVKKLSHFEAESLRKDDIIKSLQAEITDLNQQLKKASDINTIKSQAETIIALQEKIETFKEMEAENKRKDSIINKLRDEIWQQGLQISHLRFDSSIHFSDSALEDTFRSMTIDHELTTRPEISKAVVEKLSEEMLAQEEDEAGDDSIKIVVNQMEDEVGEEEMMDLGAMAHTPEFLDYDEPSEVEVEDEKQEELERLNNRNEKLRVKLREVKVHYNMARGAIISINRKWSWAEAELRKKDAEMERVQKELKDRCNQLLDMSNKFSNLRERNNHTKIMTDLQKENISLRELVAELQSGQTVNNEEIVKLKTEINKLQLHITAEDVRKRHLQAEFDKATSQGEVMQRELQDLQIALKFTGTRLERFISKIVQAVYTAPGIVQPTTQITDEDTLEMFQTILDDRLTFHRMLMESGIPVPPLLGSENPEAPPNSS